MWAGPPARAAIVDLQGVGLDERQRGVGGLPPSSVQQRDEARVLLDGHDPAPVSSRARGQAAGAGTDLDHHGAFSRPRPGGRSCG